MQNKSFEISQRPEGKVGNAKKVWVKPQVEMISVLSSRDNKIGAESQPTQNQISVYHS